MGPSFPSAISAYLHNHQPIDDENDIPRIFAEDKDVEHDYVGWAENHPQIVERNPRLFKVLEKAVDPSGKMEVEANNVNNLILSYKKDDISMDVETKSISTNNTLDLIDKILADSEVNIERFPRNYAQTALDLLEAGIITWSQLLILLSKVDAQGKLVVENKVVLRSILPRIEVQVFKNQYNNISMDVEDDSVTNLCDFLLMENQNEDCPLLHTPACFEIVVPLLYKCLNSEEDTIRTIFSATNANHDTPLHNEQIFKASIPLLRKLSSKNQLHLFTIRNHANCTILNNPEIRKMSIELIEDMKFKYRDKLLRCNCDPFGSSLDDFLSPIDKAGMKDEEGNTPLHSSTQFQALLPDLGELPPKRLLKLLTIINDEGERPLDDPDLLALSLPLFEKLSGKDLCSLFKEMEFLTDSETFEMVLPLLERVEEPVLSELLCLHYEEDEQPLFYYGNNAEIAMPLLKRLTNEHLLKVFSQTDVNDSHPALRSDRIEMMMPFLVTCDADLLNKIVSLTDEGGLMALEFNDVFTTLAPVWDKLSKETILHYFSKLNSQGHIQLRSQRSIKEHLPYLKTRDEEFLVQILSLKDGEGRNILFYYEFFEKALPLLLNLNAERLNHLFSIQEEGGGSTILHNTYIFNLVVKNFDLGKLSHQVLASRNYAGFTAIEIYTIHISMDWLLKIKPSMNVNQPLSFEEYDKKAALLKQNVDAFCETFVFGDEDWEVPKIFLEIGNAKVDSPQEIENASNAIKQALDGIIDTIINKTPWLGTPPADDQEELHKFYSKMLINFEQLLADLSKVASPAEKANPLINIAKVRLEGRCASGYQGEIDQARMFLLSLLGDDDNTEWDVRFNKLIGNVLKECIDEIVQQRAGGNVHVYNELLFQAGLALNGDHLMPQEHRNWCAQALRMKWQLQTIINKFLPLIQRLDVEQLKSYFQATTPDGYGEDFLKKKSKLQEAELNIAQDSRSQLAAEGLQESWINSCLEIFQSAQGAALKIGLPPRKNVSEAVYNQVIYASSIEDLNEAETLLSQENEIDREKKNKLMDKEADLKEQLSRPLAAGGKSGAGWLEVQLAETVKERQALTKKSMELRSEFNGLKTLAGNRIKLTQLLEQQNIPREKFEAIFKSKSLFDEEMHDLAERMDVYFVPRESGLPSLAAEGARRTDYASIFFSDREGPSQVNMRGAAEILLSIGVMEMRDLI